MSKYSNILCRPEMSTVVCLSSFFYTFRFLLIFGACLLSLVGKGIALASPFAAPSPGPGEKPVPDEQKLPVMATILATMFLPGFILGIASCWHNKNNNSNMLKTFVAHPSVVLMPTFTHFTFTSNEKLCRGRREKGEQEKEKGDSVDPFIIFSPWLTIMNVILSIVCNVAYCIIMTQISTTRFNEYLFLHLYLYNYISLYYNIPHTNIYPFITVIIPPYLVLYTLHLQELWQLLSHLLCHTHASELQRCCIYIIS